MSKTLDDIALARHIAEKAGEILIILQGSGLFEGEALGKAGGRTANHGGAAEPAAG